MRNYQHLLLGGTGFIGTELIKVLHSTAEGNILCVGSQSDCISEDGITILTENIHADSPDWVTHPAKNVFLLVGQNHVAFNKEKELIFLKKIVERINNWEESTRVFYFSSALIYGNTETPATEKFTPHPIESYSQFKHEGEQLIQELLEKKHSLCILRLSNVYGSPKNKGFIGLLMKSILAESAFTVNGGGLQLRDYIHINDVVKAIDFVVRKPQVEFLEILNIATGISFSLKEIIKIFSAILEKPINYTINQNAALEVLENRVNNTKLKEEYGYEPKIAIKEGLEKTWEIYQK